MNRRTTNDVALLLGLVLSGCVATDEADPAQQPHESAITSGGTAFYSCVFPLCGGQSLAFDSRNLMLRNCKLDARKHLECDMLAADSPAMPSAFYADAAIQASCNDGARFTCSGTTELVSCVCPDASGAGSGSTSTGRRTYEPIVLRKRIDKS